MKTITRVWILLLTGILGIAIKLNCVYCAGYYCSSYYYSSVEKYNYMVNAIVILLILSLVLDRLKGYAQKLTAGVIASVIFMLQLLTENYYLMNYNYNTFYGADEPFPFMWFVTKGLAFYLKYQWPKYHWALLGILGLCFLLVIAHNETPRVRRAIASFLYKRALNPAHASSTLCAYIFDNFCDCISKEEYKNLMGLYLFLIDTEHDEHVASARTFLAERFKQMYSDTDDQEVPVRECD